MKHVLRVLSNLILVLFVCTLTGCAAIGTSISHGHLQTQTLMSQSIFMDPTSQRSAKTIYLQVHNTTDHPNFEIKPELTTALMNKGFKIVRNPRAAHYILQINLLQLGRTSITAAKEQMKSGYGGALEGGAAAVALAGAADVRPHAFIGLGLVGAVAGTIIDNAVKDVTYSGMVDLKITVHKSHHNKIYKTRILTTADQVNLQFDQAIPQLRGGLVSSISGLFD